DTLPDDRGRLTGRSAQLGRPPARDLDDEVEPVEQRPRELVPVGGETLRRARALGSRVASATAGTEVHRSDENEARWKDGMPLHARDGDRPVLQRLPKGLQRRPVELGQLVKEEHAAMRKGGLAGPRTRA